MNNPPKIRPEWIPEAYRAPDADKATKKPSAENKPKPGDSPPVPAVKKSL